MLIRTEKFKNPHFSHKDRDSAVKKTTKDRNISEKREKRGLRMAFERSESA